MTDREHKHRIFNHLSAGRIIIILAALLLITASIAAISLKLYRASKQSNIPNDTIIVEKPKHTNPITTKRSNTDSLLANKLTELYNQYFIKDSVPLKVPAFLEEACMGYEYGDYVYFKNMDLTNINETIGKDSLNKNLILDIANYYKGISFLLLNDAQQAINNFTWLTAHSTSTEYLAKAHWYLGLAYLKNNQLNNAIEQFEKVEKINFSSNLKTKSKLVLTLLQDL